MVAVPLEDLWPVLDRKTFNQQLFIKRWKGGNLKKPNILFVYLVSIPIDDIYKSFKGQDQVIQEIVLPLGIMYLSAYLKKYQLVGEIGLLDYVMEAKNISQYKNLEEFILGTAQKKEHFTPDILAFSLNLSTQHHYFLEAAKLLKKIWPHAQVVAGGVHATNYTGPLLQSADLDWVIRGEGEMPLRKFVENFFSAKNLEIKGVYSKYNLPAAGPLERGEFIENLDEIPFPDWPLVNMADYTSNITRMPRKYLDQLQKRKLAEIMTSRGCPFRCTFCSSHTVHGRKVRFRSIENVIAEIKILYEKYGVTVFLPEDDLFTANKKRTIKLLYAIKNLNIPNLELQFPNGLSVNTTDEEIIDAMIAAGMTIATIAIESGSDYTQKQLMKKNCNLKKARRLVAYCKSKGIRVRSYFMFGLPGEKEEHMKETLDFARSLGSDWNDFFAATPLVGSEMYNKFIEMGAITDNPEMWKTSFFWERSFDTPEVKAQELNELIYRTNLDHNFFNNVNKVSGRFDEAIEIYRGILAKYPFHIIGWYCLGDCYRLKGEDEKAQEVIDKISSLIETDSRAREMYLKYGDLMTDYNFSGQIT